MNRAVVSVATDSWVVGQQRLCEALADEDETFLIWTNELPTGSPPHRDRGVCAGPRNACVPYAFKAWALKDVQRLGYETVIWADACILPLKPLAPLWERIERDGYWMAKQGYRNDEWTADSAYPDLFPEFFRDQISPTAGVFNARETNRLIPHVVATAFGLSLVHPLGLKFLDEYFRLAQTKAFCGPWQNSNAPRVEGRNTDRSAAPCGPPSTLGHRHDQSSASVIAWRLGFHFTESPDIFAYGKAGEIHDERTVLLADGSY